jgi:hypothetical protein
MWRQNHRVAGRYYSLARNVDEACDELARAAEETGAKLGFTLSAGANRYGAYLRDDLMHAYFAGPERGFAEAARLQPAGGGANVMLYAARDEGMFYLPGMVRERLGLRGPAAVRPVSPVQLYLDMKAAGGRYAEQAEELRREVLGY